MKKDTHKARPDEISENAKEVKDTFSSNNEDCVEENTEVIYYITAENLTQQLKETPKEIFETKAIRIATDRLLEDLATTTIDYCIFSGDYSVGKTTIVENAIQRINNKKAPDFFWKENNFQFIKFDAKDFIGNNYEIFITSIIYSVADLYNAGVCNIVIFIKDIQYLEEEILEVLHKMYSAMRQAQLEDVNLKFIFTVHESFWETSRNYAFLYKSVIRTIEMPRSDYMYDILIPKVQELEEIHKCSISDDLVKLLVNLVISNEGNSGVLKTYIYYIDLVLTRVELDNRKEVTRKDIFKNFQSSFNDWKSLSAEERARIAYHEAGHTVLGLIALNEYYQLIAVSSIPSKKLSSLGVTIEFFKTHIYNMDKKLLKKFLAFYFAGRESELLAGYKPNNGAGNDLAQMTEMLIDTIASTGLFEDVNKYYVYNLENGFVSEKSILAIEDEAKKFAKKASKYSRKILKENWKLVEIIATRLISDGVVSGNDVEKIYKKYLKKKR